MYTTNTLYFYSTTLQTSNSDVKIQKNCNSYTACSCSLKRPVCDVHESGTRGKYELLMSLQSNHMALFLCTAPCFDFRFV